MKNLQNFETRLNEIKAKRVAKFAQVQEADALEALRRVFGRA